jgi:hypothetical protein
MSSAGFKTTIPAIKWPQTYALDHMATRNNTLFLIPNDINQFKDIKILSFYLQPGSVLLESDQYIHSLST